MCRFATDMPVGDRCAGSRLMCRFATDVPVRAKAPADAAARAADEMMGAWHP
jgi:hypothetical protein